MDVVRIPQVSLVDSSGRSIGVYSDASDWWQQLKRGEQLEIENGEDRSASQLQHYQQQQLTLGDKSHTSTSLKHTEQSSEHNSVCNVIGETPLHVAIVYDDFYTLQMLIEKKGYDVNQRTTIGKFTNGFSSSVTANLIDQSKYEGLAYYGEYPLAFAACFADKKIYDYLLDKGADPNKQGKLTYTLTETKFSDNVRKYDKQYNFTLVEIFISISNYV